MPCWYELNNRIMIELFKQECSSIVTFKEGDIIARGEGAPFLSKEYNENLMVSTEVELYEDKSYLGDPMEYIGIKNNHIYARKLRKFCKGDVVSLHLDQWSEGWLKFELPDGVSIEDL